MLFFFLKKKKKNEVKSHSQPNEAKDALTCGACPTTSFTDGVGPFTPGAKPSTRDSAKDRAAVQATKPPSHYLAMEVVPLGTRPLPARPRTDVFLKMFLKVFL